MATTAELLPWYGLAKQGRIFTGNWTTLVLPIFSNTTQQVGLWNPLGSGVDLILHRVVLTYVSTTAAAGGFVLGYLPNAPAAVGTGLAISAFTETASISGYGVGYSSVAKYGFGATLTVTAPAVWRHIGLNQLVVTAADATTVPWKADYEFDGDAVVVPGTAIFVAGNIATLITLAGSIPWAEVSRI